MYTVDFSAKGKRDYKKLPSDVQRGLLDVFRGLERNPYNNAVKLTDTNKYRIRVGTYRVIFEIHSKKLLVIVVAAGHRRDVYRDR